MSSILERRRAALQSGQSIDWETIARGMIDYTTQFSIDANVAAAFEGLTTIEQRCFRGRSNLIGDVVLPSTLTTINSEVFTYCTSITSVTLGENVSNINNTAFTYMGSSMKALVINATTPPTLNGANALSGTPSCIVYVPDASVSTYQGAQYWSAYSSRIKGISERPTS